MVKVTNSDGWITISIPIKDVEPLTEAFDLVVGNAAAWREEYCPDGEQSRHAETMVDNLAEGIRVAAWRRA